MQQSEYTQAQLEKAIENIIDGSKIVAIKINHHDLTKSSDFDLVKSSVEEFDTLQIAIYNDNNSETQIGTGIGNVLLLNNVYSIEYIFNGILYTINLGADWETSTIEQVFRLDEEPLGIVKIWTSNELPAGYKMCDGSELDQEEYADLYAVIGDTYNTCNDCTDTPFVTAEGKFRIPDLRCRFIVGYDAYSNNGETRPLEPEYSVLGSTGGEKKHLLTKDESGLKAHNHTAQVTIEQAGEHDHLWLGDDQLQYFVAISGGEKVRSANGYDAKSDVSADNNSAVYTTGTAGKHSHSASATVNNVEGQDATEAHENRPPFYTLMYIIKVSY